MPTPSGTHLAGTCYWMQVRRRNPAPPMNLFDSAHEMTACPHDLSVIFDGKTRNSLGWTE
jgi:hypothetical protein